jgi:hypothetical protein
VLVPATFVADTRTVQPPAVPAAGVPDTTAVPSPRSRNVSPVGKRSSSVIVATGRPVEPTTNAVELPTRNVRVALVVNVGVVAPTSDNVRDTDPARFVAVTVTRAVKAEVNAGVPEMMAVPSCWSAHDNPAGNVPPIAMLGVGTPLVVTMNENGTPEIRNAELVLVMLGARDTTMVIVAVAVPVAEVAVMVTG